jgi:hypothetical protein
MKPKGAQYVTEPRIGSRSEYSLEYKSPYGGVQTGSMTVRVDGQETIGGKRYYKVVSTFFGVPGLDQQVGFERWSSDGVFAVDGDHRDKPEYLDTPLPIGVGTSWITQAPDSRTTYQVVGLETVETRTKTYKDCLRVTFERNDKDGASQGTTYLCPSVGMTKLLMTASGVPMTFTLENYKR